MKYEVIFHPIAQRDMLKISDSLSGYQGKAKRLFGEMESGLKLLEFMPHMWPKYRPAPEYRQMDLDGYVLLYTVDENQRKVKAYRVLSGKMDAEQQISARPDLRVVDTSAGKNLPAFKVVEAEAEGE